MPGRTSRNPFFKPAQIPLRFATDDPVGGADHSLPIHPDQGSSRPMEYWEDQLHQRRPRKRPPQAPEQKRPRDEDHQIDDYA